MALETTLILFKPDAIEKNLTGKVLASPALYRAAVGAAAAGIEHLPQALLYNPFNAWGKQRDVPDAPGQTFRQWYVANRGAKKP